MLGIIFFGLAAAAGLLAIRYTKLPLTRSEQIAAGATVGIVMASWLGLAAASILGPAKGLWTTVIVLMVIMTALYLKTRQAASKTLTEPKLGSRRLRLLNWLLIIITASLLLWLAHSHFLPTVNGHPMSVGYTWADLGIHAALIASFAKKTVLDLTLPIYAGARLTYPFMVDFFSAQMLRAGAGWQLSLLLPTIALLYATVRLLIGLVYRLSQSLRAAWIATIMVLLSGSAWGAVLFFKDALIRHQSISLLLTQDYSKLDQNHLQYANFITSHLLPQRAYLFGLACTLVFFLCAWELVDKAKERAANAPVIWLAGLILGAMPLIHTHSFLIAGGFGGVLWIVASLHQGKIHRPLLGVLVIGAILALPQLIWQFGGSYHGGFGGWQLGWLTPPHMNVATFWLRQLGLAAVLFLLGPWLLRRQKAHFFTVTLYWFGVVIFVIANLYVFQPSAWDNMKFFTYAYMMMIIPAAIWLATVSRSRSGKVILAAVLVLTCATGVIALLHEAQASYIFASTNDQQAAHVIEREVPPKAVVLINPALHHNPIAMLAGRNLFTGYNGWLWSYGIDYGPRENEALAMLGAASGNTDSLLKRNRIDYVAISDDDVKNGVANQAFYETNYRQVVQKGGWRVFKVNP